MDAARLDAAAEDSRFDGLHAEAKAALAYSANTLRAVRDRYRAASIQGTGRWHAMRDELGRLEWAADAGARAPERPAAAASDAAAADAAEASAADMQLRLARSEVDRLGTEVAGHEQELSKLELAVRHLEATWLFLERGDRSLLSEEGDGAAPFRMRLVEAQEAERSRLAQEVHDGPAQALSNAIFQVEYIERILEGDPVATRSELRLMRELLRRELADVRAFVSHLRPPVLDELGLAGAIAEGVDRIVAASGIPIETELTAPQERLGEPEQVVVLRVMQEALHNVRKHAAAGRASVRTAVEDETWVLEIRDDGRGFDVGAVAARGRRNFGLQFMQERAELIGARLEVRSRPEGGTVVRLAIPIEEQEAR